MQPVQTDEGRQRPFSAEINRPKGAVHTSERTLYTIGFILEQGLGHRTHALNLQATVGHDRAVRALWQPMEQQTSGLWAKLPLVNRYWTVQAGLRARQAIAQMQRQTPLDALFFHTQVMAVLATNWVKQIPSVISLDATPLQYDALGEYYTHARERQWLEDQKWRMNRNCFRHARHLVTWSHWAKYGLIDEYEVPAEKVTVVPPGIDVQTWQRATPRQGHTGPVKLLFVGGNLKRKGGNDLLTVFQQLRQEWTPAGDMPAVELHMVTHDPVPPQPGVHVYQEMAPNSPALRQLFHECDLFCLPTYGDCLPLALVEASAAGLPCVTTRVGGTDEIVKQGETGFLIEPGDTAALVHALRLLVTNTELRLQFGTQAVNVVHRRFNANHNTNQLLDILKHAANQRLPQFT
jgi:glycosyltransferase involved in cell wall biosynthesis